jgi:PAS domain S-box-containing protein
VVESTDDAIITESLEGIITSWNPAAERLFGYSDAEMIGHPISMLFPPDHLDDETQNLARLMRGERLEHFETVRISKEGKSIDVSATSSPLLNDSGEVVGASKILRDISDRKAKDAKLQIANKELMRANRLKDDFLANMSHELRTPLNSILGMNEGLQEGIFGSINERQLKALRTIENSSTHLLALINDILDVAKIESGQVSLDLAVTNIESICTSSLAFIKQQALTKRIQLIPRIPEYLPEIKLDERRIRQALINLLNNAVKFTLEGGTITLEVSEVQLESSTTNLTPLNYLKIAVIDTGIGISSENIQKLFQPFIQIDSALNRQYDGTGLGLALVKRLVELHGGNVELTSELGVGSCFAINLPFNIGSPAIEEQTDQDLSGQSQIGLSQTEELISPLILLAENNKSNIATFSSYLEAKGYRILLATDGQQAIDLAEAHHPDLILLDIQISGMDGLEAIKEIRLNPDLVNIPIIALTALAMAGDREKCLEAGANEYLSKPIKLKTLADTIWTILQA